MSNSVPHLPEEVWSWSNNGSYEDLSSAIEAQLQIGGEAITSGPILAHWAVRLLDELDESEYQAVLAPPRSRDTTLGGNSLQVYLWRSSSN